MSKTPVDGDCHKRFAEVREIFEQSFAGGDEIGSAVAFSLDGELVVDLWGGHCDEERTREWQRDTLVNVYSTTKGMTALCANQLIASGAIDLAAPVAEYWPEFAQAGKAELPVRYLLTHQAGLPGIRKPLPPGSLYDWERMTSALAEQEPWWEPGEKHGYHAITFGHLVGELVRRVSGKTLGRYFREHVAEPLEADFYIGFGPELDARVSDLHGSLAFPKPTAAGANEPAPEPKAEDSSNPVLQMLRDMTDPTTMTGAAFLNPPQRAGDHNTREWRAAELPALNGHTTARALAQIYGVLSRGGVQRGGGVRILPADQIDRMIEEQVGGPDAIIGGLPFRYGLGFMLRTDMMPLSPGPRAFGHPGAGGSIGMADPDARVGFGFTLNKMKMGMMGGAAGFQMVRAFFQAL